MIKWLCGVLVLFLARAAAQLASSWRVGRATFYGTDAWSIHEGSCHYGYLWPDEPLGWDIAAMTDTDYAYIGSCGRCFEVRCNPSSFKDGYGSPLDRTGVCFNPRPSVVIRISDTCPCVYVGNPFSNKRWCCGDMPHLDMSAWAFEKLADKKWGVIGISLRPVPCDFKPELVAPAVANPGPGQAPPPGAKKVNRGYNWQLAALSSVSVQWSSVPRDIYINGPKKGWDVTVDAGSSVETTTPLGIRGGENAVCVSLGPAGRLDFRSEAAQAFVDASLIELWSNQEFGMAPAVRLSLLSDQGPALCRSLVLREIAPVGFGAGGLPPADNGAANQRWVRYVIDLVNFQDGCATSLNTTFAGCSGTPVGGLTGISISNALPGVPQAACFDGLRMLSNAAGAQQKS